MILIYCGGGAVVPVPHTLQELIRFLKRHFTEFSLPVSVRLRVKESDEGGAVGR